MEEFNLIPSPRLLEMLGNIPFKGWQCVAELVDNSIDAIINNRELDDFQRKIAVSIPTKKKILANEPLIIEDWGVGMTEIQLQNAVKAGFSSKNTGTDLGLFGMGFNVATARLANTVDVWTSTAEMEDEIGLSIDLQEMKRTGSFIRPKKTRKKWGTKKSGTRIEIYNYKPDVEAILKPLDIARELSRAYSEAIFNLHRIKITVNDKELVPFQFCVWDRSRYVKYKNEEVHAVIDINELLKEEMFCENCFAWLGEEVNTTLSLECPYCHRQDQVTKKSIKISGWVGIQRYSDLDHYGIDISRNGRVVSKLDKTLFRWDDEKGKEYPDKFQPEYPRDTTYAGGRIVGQIEANFLVPTYTKDDFRRDDRNWKKVVHFLRGEMPLQPELAGNFGYNLPNRSPIGLLFNGYRKINLPGPKTMVFAREDGSVDHVTPRAWAQKFYTKDPGYQDDSKWWEAVTKSDLKDSNSTHNPLNPTAKPSTSRIPGLPGLTSADNDKYPGKKILKKTLRFDIEKLIGEKPFDLTLIDYTPSADCNLPIIFEPEGQARFKVYLNNTHPLFRDFADGYEDLVYMEVAGKYAHLKANPQEWPISRVYYELKSRHAPETMLSVPNLVTKANNLLREIQNQLVRGEGIALPRSPTLSEAEQKHLVKRYLDLEAKAIQGIDSFVLNTRYLKYLDLNYLFKFIKEFPEVIFDGKILSLPYEDLDEENKAHMLQKYTGYLEDVRWFTNDLSKEGDEAVRKLKQQIIRNRYSIEILYDSINK
jgi:hypothetical protein